MKEKKFTLEAASIINHTMEFDAHLWLADAVVKNAFREKLLLEIHWRGDSERSKFLQELVDMIPAYDSPVFSDQDKEDVLELSFMVNRVISAVEIYGEKANKEARKFLKTLLDESPVATAVIKYIDAWN